MLVNLTWSHTTEPSHQSETPAFRISFEKNNIVFSFWGRNILNTDYNSFYFQALGNSYAQIGKPATMGLNLKLTF